MTQVGVERGLQAVEDVGFVEGAGETALTTRAVVGGDKNEGVLEFIDELLDFWFSKEARVRWFDSTPEFDEALRRTPFLRLLVPLAIGIFCGLSFPELVGIPMFWFGITGLVLVVGLWFFSKVRGYRFNWIFGILVHFFLIWAGIFSVAIRQYREPNFSAMATGGPILVIPLQSPEEKPATYAVPVKIKRPEIGNNHFVGHGKLMAYFEKDSMVAKIQPGAPLILETRIGKFMPPSNPGEFNYARYMRDHGFYGRIFVSKGDWKQADLPKAKSAVILASEVRNFLSQKVKNALPAEDISTLVLALTMGEREQLSEEVRASFINAGVIHVIAISGLHVGIIYLVIMYILSFLEKRQGGLVIRSLLMVFFLWFYAFLVGLSPSVMRAATMFSFLGMGRALKRSPNVFNSLAISAFILLCINPAQIRDVSFQLSYLAVAGILLFYPKIYALTSSRYWLVDRLWRLVSLSLSAQLGAFPLVLFYFHQFPTWFLLTNLVAIPLVTLIIYGGFLLLIFSFSGLLTNSLSVILSWLVKTLLVSVKTIGAWPHAVIHPIFISSIGLVLLYFFLVLLAGFIYSGKIKWLKVSLLSLVFFSVTELVTTYKYKDQKNFEVLNIPGITALQFIEGSEACLYTLPGAGKDTTRVRYEASGGWNHLRVKNVRWVASDTGQIDSLLDHTLWFGKKGFQFLYKKGYIMSQEESFHSSSTKTLHVNWLILSGDCWLDPRIFLNSINPDLVIVSSAVPSYLLERYAVNLEAKNQPYYIIKTNGAYFSKLKSKPSNLFSHL